MSFTAAQRRHADVARRVQTVPHIVWPGELGARKWTQRQARLAEQSRRVKYEPQTEFGRRMLELRRAVEATGEKLLTLEEIRNEVRLRGGERG